MKAYKASYNGKCRDITYQVGKTYEIDNIKICKRGFHACRKMSDTLFYYTYHYKEFVLFEVELLGEVIDECDKMVTDKMKIIRIVPRNEYVGFDRFNKFSDGNEINNETYHNDSIGVEYTITII